MYFIHTNLSGFLTGKRGVNSWKTNFPFRWQTRGGGLLISKTVRLQEILTSNAFSLYMHLPSNIGTSSPQKVIHNITKRQIIRKRSTHIDCLRDDLATHVSNNVWLAERGHAWIVTELNIFKGKPSHEISNKIINKNTWLYQKTSRY